MYCATVIDLTTISLLLLANYTTMVNGGKKLNDGDREKALLARMLDYHMKGNDDIIYEKLRVELGIGLRVKSWTSAWKALETEGFIESASAKGFRMTQKGLDHAATDEYKEFLKDSQFVPQTNEEKQDRIKKRLQWRRGSQIFDLLLKHGSLTGVEIAALLGIKRGSHPFSYALKELKDKSHVELDPDAKGGRGKKLRLADTVFLNPDEDRPEPIVMDPEVLAKAVKDNAERKRGSSASNTAEPKRNKKAKTDASNPEEVTKNESPKKEDSSVKEEPVKEEPDLQSDVKKEPSVQSCVKKELDSQNHVKKEPSFQGGVKKEPEVLSCAKEEGCVKKEPEVQSCSKEECVKKIGVKEESNDDLCSMDETDIKVEEFYGFLDGPMT